MKTHFGLLLGLGILSAALSTLAAVTAGGTAQVGGSGSGSRSVRANAQAGVSSSGATPIIQNASYIYIMPRAVTRARMIHAEAVHRGDAIRRQQQARAAQQTNSPAATNNSQNTVVPSPPNTVANNITPTPQLIFPNFQQPTRLPVTNTLPRPNTIITATPADTPRVLPIHETSGPTYNDRDPLLGYQREQAEKGNPESEYALGLRYLSGAGLDQSDVLARQWLEKSSAHGNLKARAKLRELDNEK